MLGDCQLSCPLQYYDCFSNKAFPTLSGNSFHFPNITCSLITVVALGMSSIIPFDAVC